MIGQIEEDDDKMEFVSVDELTTLRAKAKAYDDAEMHYAIFNKHGALITSDKDKEIAWLHAKVWSGSACEVKHLQDQGWSCEKIRVCKEVENDT